MFEAITLKRVSNAFAPKFELLPLKVAPYAVQRAGKIAVKVIKDGLK
ncbi:MAG: hypothetical protein BWY87_01389 [Deltaproteobacteria bacterium ADurb.Bin510]|jgi:hypothetical protein|nr:MAG: hypothetical protein BWY87_01389 [Deltaproteobacteria bacterium ADurb.Bin510]